MARWCWLVAPRPYHGSLRIFRQAQQHLPGGTMMTPTQSPGTGYRDDEGMSMDDEEHQDLISPPRPGAGPRQRRNNNEVTNKLPSVHIRMECVFIRWQVLTLGHYFANFLCCSNREAWVGICIRMGNIHMCHLMCRDSRWNQKRMGGTDPFTATKIICPAIGHIFVAM
jgi:hypothetical protein